MAVKDQKLDRLEKMLSMVQSSVTKKEFVDAFKVVVDTIQGLRKSNETEFGLIHDNFQILASKIKQDSTSSLEDIKNQVDHLFVSNQLDKIRAAINDQVNYQMSIIDQKLNTIKDGERGLQGPPGKPGKTTVIVKPDNTSLKRIDDELFKLKETNKRIPGWGAHPLTVQSSGVTADENARVLNFIGGTITHRPDGVDDITTGSGSGNVVGPNPSTDTAIARYNGITGQIIKNSIPTINDTGGISTTINSGSTTTTTILEETPTGVVDGLNAIFTFVNLPSVVFLNGAYQIAGGVDYTLSGTYTVTFGSAPVANSLIRSLYSTSVDTLLEETPGGTIDGINTEFTITNTSISVFLNGSHLKNGIDYIGGDTSLSFTTAPSVGSLIRSLYTGGTITAETPSGSVNNINTVFAYANNPAAVFLNGLYQIGGGVDYTLSGTYVTTFVTPPRSGSLLGGFYTGISAGTVGMSITQQTNQFGLYVQSDSPFLSTTSDAVRIHTTSGTRSLYIKQEADAAAIIIDANSVPNTTYGANMTVFNIDGKNAAFSMVKMSNNGVSTTNNTNLFVQNTNSATKARVIAIHQFGLGSALYILNDSTANPAIEIDGTKYAMRADVSISGGYGLYIRTTDNALIGSVGIAKFEDTNTSSTANLVTLAKSGNGTALSITQSGDAKAIDINSSSLNNPAIVTASKFGCKHTVNTNSGYGLLILTDGIATVSPSGGLARISNQTVADSNPVLIVENLGVGRGLYLTHTGTAGTGLDIVRTSNSASAVIGAQINATNASTGGIIGLKIVSTIGTGGGTVVGLQIALPSGGTANYALQFSDTGGTAAGGIQFGTDSANLYRSTANTLKTDGKFIATGLNFTDNEVVSGSGTTFTLAATPTTGSVHLFGQGQRLIPTTDFTIAGAVITTVNSWAAGTVLADYRT